MVSLDSDMNGIIQKISHFISVFVNVNQCEHLVFLLLLLCPPSSRIPFEPVKRISGGGKEKEKDERLKQDATLRFKEYNSLR